MYIVDHRKPTLVDFDSLSCGDVFIDVEGGDTHKELSMKIDEIKCQLEENGAEVWANAVCLTDGALWVVDEHQQVCPVKARVEVYA